VGQRRPCSVEMSSSESKLRNGNVISETCPPSGSGRPLQGPSVTSEGNVTLKLTAKGLHDIENPPAHEKDPSQEPSLTLWRTEDDLFIKVKNTRIEDHPVLQYTDMEGQLYMARVSCAQQQPKRRPRARIQRQDPFWEFNLIPTTPHVPNYTTADNPRLPYSTSRPSSLYPSDYFQDLSEESVDEYWGLPSIPSNPYGSSAGDLGDFPDIPDAPYMPDELATPLRITEQTNAVISSSSRGGPSTAANTDKITSMETAGAYIEDLPEESVDMDWHFPSIPPKPYNPAPFLTVPAQSMGFIREDTVGETSIEEPGSFDNFWGLTDVPNAPHIPEDLATPMTIIARATEESPTLP
ncbi:hypothetical protein NFI96_028802, partial [Prochilodus magdalenae]